MPAVATAANLGSLPSRAMNRRFAICHGRPRVLEVTIADGVQTLRVEIP